MNHMKNKAPINREEQLQDSFNLFWNNSLQTTGEDYYSKMSIQDLIALKNCISCVNIIITLKTTLSFVDYILSRGIVSRTVAKQMKAKILGTNANANGFDLEYTGKKYNVIAEIKCNNPISHNTFGAKQNEGIIEDLKGLIEGKSTSTVDVSKCLKFMVLLNGDGVKESMRKLIKGYNKDSKLPVIELKEEEDVDLSNDCVYVVYLEA